MKRFVHTVSAAALAIGLGTAAAQDAPTNVYFGDTHLHTGNSFDVYLFGTPTSTPETAVRFAKGLPVVSPTTGTRWQLSEPLDFVVVSDHAEMLGAMPRLFLEDDPDLVSTETGEALRELGGEQSDEELQAVYDLMTGVTAGVENDYGIGFDELNRDLGGEKIRVSWERNIEVMEKYNDPGRFTAIIGWEWSAQPGGGNLHRVIFMPEGGEVAREFLPYSSMESDDPEDLWAWLDETSARTGASFLAIPHNPNISMGMMFPTETNSGGPITREYAETRSRWEPVVEATQIKGDSETHPMLSPNDEFADYETYNFVITPDGLTPDPTKGDYVRSGLLRGLAYEAELGVNPYKVGMIGSTDSHTGMSSIEETSFGGKGQHDATPEKRPHPTGIGASKGWDMGAAGIVGVWAPENNRTELVDAFRRKEVYASTGPRMKLRFFGGYDFRDRDLRADNMASRGYDKGVPMGGDLARDGDKAPSFMVALMKDPNGANLDRIQIIKGYLNEDGTTGETIYDVALSDDRRDGGIAVGNTVNLETGEYTNSIGATELRALWKDPDFDPDQAAFYYVRGLEIPTPRYSLLDSIALGIDWEETGRPATIQERVYSSPIWYTPQ